jgi:hypothetical protein
MKYPDKKLGRPRKGVEPLAKDGGPVIVAKYPGECTRCSKGVRKGDWVRFDKVTKELTHTFHEADIIKRSRSVR